MMNYCNYYDYRTRRHIRHAEGEVWEQHDGPDFVGYYKNIGGEAVRITKEEYDEHMRQIRDDLYLKNLLDRYRRGEGEFF